MKRLLSIIVLLCLSASLYAQQPAKPSLPTPLTVTFVNWGDTMPIKMDIYYPEQRRADSTTVLYLFGGGFVNGSRDSTSSLNAVKALLEKGFVAVSSDYRLGLNMVDFDTVHLRTVSNPFFYSIHIAVEDCSHAIRYLCDHSQELGILPDRIVLTGCSAGAITVAETDYFRANNMPPTAALPKGWKPLAVAPYSGGIFCKRGNLSYATPPAPTMIVHGTLDKIVNYNKFHSTGGNILYGGNQLAKHFAKQKYPYWILRFEDRGHEASVYLPYTIQEFTAFVELTLAGRKTFYDATCTDTALPQWEWAQMNIFQLYFK